ncbi:MAG: mechanosensitive ion channel [Fimbriimonadaceae bacterium]|nr:mechanosensitive ion channel [Fimbriimonadaceae bacterium]QYK56135.1 MAG: mechanosensitive ion channel [Fimbriimonadaceae bacterium]
MRLVWVCALSLWFATGLAQIVPGQQQAPPQAVPVGLESPRATMDTFLRGMNDGDLGQAVKALDLSWVSLLERPDRGPKLAFQLWAVLNRQEYIVLDKLSSSPEAKPYTLAITTRRGSTVGQVTIAKQDDKAFRFTSDTLEDLPRIWELVRSKPVITGLEDPNALRFDTDAWAEGQLPEEARRPVLGIAVWKLGMLGALVVVAVAMGALVQILARVLGKRVLRLEKSSRAYRELAKASMAANVLIAGGLLRASLPFLNLPGPVAGAVGFIARLAEVVGFTLIAFAAWDAAVFHLTRRLQDRTGSGEKLVAPVLSRLGKAVMGLVAALVVLGYLGVNITGLVATLGLGGVVLALAAKDSVENLFGSLMVLIERPFRIGDWVRLGSIDGEVEDIQLRSTRIRTFEDSVIILPNRTLVTDSVENFGMRRFRRLRTTIGVTYDTPPEKLAEFTKRIREMLREHPQVWDEKRYVYFNDFGPSSLTILLYCFLTAATYQEELVIRDDLLLRIVRIADEVGVEFAFPTQTLHVKDETLPKFLQGSGDKPNPEA